MVNGLLIQINPHTSDCGGYWATNCIPHVRRENLSNGKIHWFQASDSKPTYSYVHVIKMKMS